MSYTLYHGDCLDILPTLDACSVDVVICDPPYGTTACKWDSVIPFEPMWRELKRLIKPRGAIVLFGSQPFTSALVMSNPKWFRYEWVWQKISPSNYLDANRRPLGYHENISVFSAGRDHDYYPQREPGARNHSRNAQKSAKVSDLYGGTRPRLVADTSGLKFPRTVVTFGKHSSSHKLHPNEKPLALMEYLVKTYTNEGDTVLDFTMGSGTTGHACANTGRRFIGIERDAGYFATAEQRIASAYDPLGAMREAV